MKFIIDENVREEVKEFLKSEKYDISILPLGSSDEEIAQVAQETEKTVLTHDHHFADILKYPPCQYPGIIRIKIHPPNPDTIINSLKFLLARLTSEEIKGKLIILEKEGFRIRE